MNQNGSNARNDACLCCNFPFAASYPHNDELQFSAVGNCSENLHTLIASCNFDIYRTDITKSSRLSAATHVVDAAITTTNCSTTISFLQHTVTTRKSCYEFQRSVIHCKSICMCEKRLWQMRSCAKLHHIWTDWWIASTECYGIPSAYEVLGANS